MTAYTDARALELLLSVIFVPHNSYCVHLDPKVAQNSKQAATSLFHLWHVAPSSVTLDFTTPPPPPHPNHLSVAHTLHRPLCTVLIKFHYFDHSPQFCPKFTIYKNRQTQTSWSLYRTCSSATGFVFLTLT